jgi:hypothetical protein
MPDWNALVRERLNLAGLRLEEREEVAAELAAHLDDLYEQCRAQGLSESDAISHVISEVSDWRGLAKTIQRAKRTEGTMTINSRSRSLWLPGLASIVATQVLPQRLFHAVVHLGLWSPSRDLVAMSFSLELAAFVLCGAVGAFLSCWAGGGRLSRLTSASFPVVTLVAMTVFGSGVPLWLLHWVPALSAQLGSAPFRAFLNASTIAVDGVALFLGALPFLGAARREPGVAHA